MNDGLRTDMFLRYKPETIACACIQLAVKTVNRPIILPKDPFPWFVKIYFPFLFFKI